MTDNSPASFSRAIQLPCLASAFFDENKIAYVCTKCFCVVGSVGQPRSCRGSAGVTSDGRERREAPE